MLINTLKTKKRLVEEYGADDRLAEGIVEIISSAEDQLVTKAMLKSELRRWALRIVLGNAAVMAALLALFQYAA